MTEEQAQAIYTERLERIATAVLAGSLADSKTDGTIHEYVDRAVLLALTLIDTIDKREDR